MDHNPLSTFLSANDEKDDDLVQQLLYTVVIFLSIIISLLNVSFLGHWMLCTCACVCTVKFIRKINDVNRRENNPFKTTAKGFKLTW